MTRSANLAWVLLFWLIGVPLLVGGPLVGMVETTGGTTSSRALWMIGPSVVGFALMAFSLYRLVSAAQRSQTNLFETGWLRRYYVELGAALAVYLAGIVVQLLTPPSSSELVASVVAAAPIPGVLLIALAIARFVLTGDEYWRMQALQDVGITAATTAAWTMSYGYLERAGFPRLSMFWVWPSMVLAWAVCRACRGLLRR